MTSATEATGSLNACGEIGWTISSLGSDQWNNDKAKGRDAAGNAQKAVSTHAGVER